PSENAMLTPSPVTVASPAKNAECGWWVANATANTGASVDSEPSIRPVIAGCARCSRNDRSARRPDVRIRVRTVMVPLQCDRFDTVLLVSYTADNRPVGRHIPA